MSRQENYDARPRMRVEEVVPHTRRKRRPPMALVETRPAPTLLLAACAVLARNRAEEAEAHAARLQERVRELETWLTREAQFDEVEQVQLGRLLALSSLEREQRRGPLLLSLRALLLFLYSAAALALAVLLALGQV